MLESSVELLQLLQSLWVNHYKWLLSHLSHCYYGRIVIIVTLSVKKKPAEIKRDMAKLCNI